MLAKNVRKKAIKTRHKEGREVECKQTVQQLNKSLTFTLTVMEKNSLYVLFMCSARINLYNRHPSDACRRPQIYYIK